ncbi:hypothetical protein ACP4OV_014571 [Aristida adscensionis]
MDLVTGALGSLAPKLLQLLQDEYKLQQGVKKKIKFVSDELESIHGALRKVAAVPPDQLDEQVKIWARQVREASYSMEDILDTFLVRVEGRLEPSGQGRLKRAVKKMGKLFTKGKACHGIAGAIEDMKKQLQEVAERRARYGVDDIVIKPATTSAIDPRLEAMYKEATQLIGMDNTVDELIPMLSLQGDDVSNKKMKIVSVVGVGGLGKTTLAKAAYDKLKPQFDCGAFVPVGRNPDLKKVFRDILKDLERKADPDITILDERQLINELRDFLGCKRYFIVIDDVWDKQSWEIISWALVDSNRGSRVIKTTRNFDVASGDEIYKMQPLLDNYSKKLFYTRIFGGEGKWPDNQEDEVSDKILKKCGGVPLAIITMASLLVGKSREKWLELCNSAGFRDKDIEQVDKTMWILSLSYYDLPCHLKTCLLYLSAYPEDHVIHKNELIWKWIAEGFVHKKPGIGLFEVGEGYFNDLVNRSLIQAVEDQRIIYGCRVHDMVLDMLRTFSREENFVTVVDNNEDTSSLSSARRLSYQNRVIEYNHLDNHKDTPKVRSFIAHVCDKALSFQSFKLLRMLALEDVRTEGGCDAMHLGSLVHLRYLSLKDIEICELPKEIGALKFLQTLILVNTKIKELPSSLGLLTQLVCLHVECIRDPDGIIKKLTSLEELQIEFNRDDEYKRQFVKDLGSLCELRLLYISIKMDERMRSDFLQSVGNLHKIQQLVLDNDCIELDKANWDTVVLGQHLRHLEVLRRWCSRLPSCINHLCLPNLSYLILSVNDMDEHDLKVLGGLPELRYLKLSTWSTVTLDNIATDGCFNKLRYCHFGSSMVQFVLNEDSSISLTLWNGTDNIAFGSRKKDQCRVAPAVMPNLEELRFKVQVWSMSECKGSYDSLGLEYLTSLQQVEMIFDCHRYSYNAEMETEAALKHAIDTHPNRPRAFHQILHSPNLSCLEEEAYFLSTRWSHVIVDRAGVRPSMLTSRWARQQAKLSVLTHTGSHGPTGKTHSSPQTQKLIQEIVNDMDEHDLKVLGGLPELRYLKLSTWSTVTLDNIATDGCFNKLRYCHFGSSMVQFVLNEDSSISLTLWNGTDNIAFGSRKKDQCRVAPAVMPNLEELRFKVQVWSMSECKGSYDSLGLEYLTSLQQVEMIFDCHRYSYNAEMETEAALKHAIDTHPNRPRAFHQILHSPNLSCLEEEAYFLSTRWSHVIVDRAGVRPSMLTSRWARQQAKLSVLTHTGSHGPTGKTHSSPQTQKLIQEPGNADDLSTEEEEHDIYFQPGNLDDLSTEEEEDDISSPVDDDVTGTRT